jgi:hypothetical protein
VAANFLDLITANGEAVMFIRSLIETSQSANSILTSLRANGLKIANSTGNQIINYLRSQPSQAYVQTLPEDQLPNLQRVPSSLTQTLRNYSYTYRFEGVSRLTGETLKRYVTISSNDLLTKQQAQAQAIDVISNEEKYEQTNDTQVFFESLTQRENPLGL